MVMQLRPYYDLGHGATLSLCFSPFYIKSEVHLQKVWTQIRAEFRPDLHSKLFDTDSMPERIICKVNFENQPANDEKKNHKTFPSMHRIKDKFIEGAHRLGAHRLCVYLACQNSRTECATD